MENQKSAILEKVKKLMALGDSPNEAEAASALEKAQLLLARHGLVMADLQEAQEPLDEAVLLEKKRLRKWESYLISVIAKATFTEPLHFRSKTQGKVFLVGRKVNTAAAEALFSYLHITILRWSRKHRSKIEHLDSYRIGMVLRIGERLDRSSEEKEQGENLNDGVALVPSMKGLTHKENRDYIHEKYGRTGKKRVSSKVDASSFSLGQKHGAGVSLDPQLES